MICPPACPSTLPGIHVPVAFVSSGAPVGSNEFQDAPRNMCCWRSPAGDESMREVYSCCRSEFEKMVNTPSWAQYRDYSGYRSLDDKLTIYLQRKEYKQVELNAAMFRWLTLNQHAGPNLPWPNSFVH